MKLALALLLLATPAFAEDFDGAWKVPDEQQQNPARCKGGDQKECLRLAWTAEAGIRGAGDTETKRLEKARDWHAKACTIAKQKPCANADRVQKKLDAAKALKTDAERAQFWCGDALEGAARFTDTSVTAPVIVASACTKLFPKDFQKALSAVAGTNAEMKSSMLLVAAHESICPTLKTKPASCTKPKDVTKLSQAMRVKMLANIFQAALTGEAAARAEVLASWMTK